jgi:hypothetical protein
MKEPERFLSSENEFDRMLLCSGLDEAPPVGSVDKTLVALGVSTGAVLVGATAATAAGSSAAGTSLVNGAAIGGAVGGSAVVKTAATGIGLGKLVGALAIAGGVATGGVMIERSIESNSVSSVEPKVVEQRAEDARPVIDTRGPSSPSLLGEAKQEADVNPPVEAIEEAPKTPVAVVESPASPELVHRSNTKRDDKASAPESRGTPAEKAEKAAPAAPKTGKLTDELRLLDSARSHLRSGQPLMALGDVEQYRKKFPKGMLAAEASALRIDILTELGRKDEAKGAAQSYKEQFPEGPYSHRVDATIQDPKK